MHLPFLPPALAGRRPAPRWDPLTPTLSALSKRACTHPIHTVVIIALLASTSYINLLENSMFGSRFSFFGRRHAKGVDLMDRRVDMIVGEATGWQWLGGAIDKDPRAEKLALVPMRFPSEQLEALKPLVPEISGEELPSDDPVARVYALPLERLPDFLGSVETLPVQGAKLSHDPDVQYWALQIGRSPSLGIVARIEDAVCGVWSLVQNADALDVAIMVLGYISMHLTFLSLFVSMKRLGSKFWLATTVLISSTFAFLFASLVTYRLGVPINMVLLSEGLPFLVVTIGFEKPIILTRAVLDASVDLRKKSGGQASIQSAVAVAVQDVGFQIIRDYAIEMGILALGATSGVQGGLRQFCFLAGWILAFDCVLLFTFYTAILTIKLEINRIKRHVALRKALEEDGVSHRVAENVANADKWPRSAPEDLQKGLAVGKPASVFGKTVKDSTVVRFKVLMVSGFVFVNLCNLFTLPFRDTPRGMTSKGGGAAVSSMDVWKIARKGLETLSARRIPLAVTLLQPLDYRLQHVNTNPSLIPHWPPGSHSVPYGGSGLLEGTSGGVVDGILRSVEDPILSKWIIFALTISLVFNGYLFNAARWTVKEPMTDLTGREAVITPDVAAEPTREECAKLASKQTLPPLPPLPVVQPVSKRDFNDKTPARTVAECEAMVKAKRGHELTNGQLLELATQGKIAGYMLEKILESNRVRAVAIRRSIVSRTPSTADRTATLETSLLPFEGYDYDRVHGACCENVIGYLPLPVGAAGPLNIDGMDYYLPMATTEGVLVASTSRGCKAINAGGGAVTVITGDGMTRGPVVKFPSVVRAGIAKNWIDSEDGQRRIKESFDGTSRFARLRSVRCAIAGTMLYIRFRATTGDAMGMNMISKGTEKALADMQTEFGFDDMEIIAVSGNYCTDKKPAAINWVEGRGKSVVAEALVPSDTVERVLKSNVDDLVMLNSAKNHVGSAMAGSVGGFNAHAANIVTAIFLATGQDPAQNVESSNCITLMEKTTGGHLRVSVSMPSIEVGTLGGGTILEPQGAMLDLLGVRGSHPTSPGDNARQLARIVAAAVLAGELSLCSALAAGHLVQSHMAHNRSAPVTRTNTPAPETSKALGTLTSSSITLTLGERRKAGK